jgi:hypothetical protein
MNYRNSLLALVTLFVLSGTLSAISASRIEYVVRVTSSPALYERTDFDIILTAEWTDPYKSEDVKLDLVLTSPAGKTVTLPAYYVRGSSGSSSEWQARFAPMEKGEYKGRFVLTDRTGDHESAPLAFAVGPSDSKGFLHADGFWTFRFDNGERFRGIGENFCWEAREHDDSTHSATLNENLRFNNEYMFGKLASCGGNFTRVWMCSWSIPLEWKHVMPGASPLLADDTGHFNRTGMASMDRMVDVLERSGLYVMLTMGQHGEFRDQIWDLNNYNKVNGGPLTNPLDFFSNPAAKQMYKDRLRYIVARWGYSTHIAAWEFFNEVDIVVPEGESARLPKAAITAWHAEMSAYLKSIDPYGHIRTTSVTSMDIPGLNDVPDIDLNQRHLYRKTKTIPKVIRAHLTHGKPYVIGEFGYDWDWTKDFSTFADKMDYDFKEGLWTGLFSPTPILPMTWWWEFYDDRGVSAYYRRVRAMSDRMMASGSMENIDASWSGDDAEVYAVKAGRTVFVLLVNRSTKAVRGSLKVPAIDGAQRLKFYDTETDAFSDIATTKNLTVPARNSVILIAE